MESYYEAYFGQDRAEKRRAEEEADPANQHKVCLPDGSIVERTILPRQIKQNTRSGYSQDRGFYKESYTWATVGVDNKLASCELHDDGMWYPMYPEDFK